MVLYNNKWDRKAKKKYLVKKKKKEALAESDEEQNTNQSKSDPDQVIDDNSSDKEGLIENAENFESTGLDVAKQELKVEDDVLFAEDDLEESLNCLSLVKSKIQAKVKDEFEILQE